jgi:membrane-anchored protein YejM (alkaline phosphatase superfamily)
VVPGKLDNTVVIITGGHGKPLNVKHDSFDWSREQLPIWASTSPAALL